MPKSVEDVKRELLELGIPDPSPALLALHGASVSQSELNQQPVTVTREQAIADLAAVHAEAAQNASLTKFLPMIERVAGVLLKVPLA